MLQASEYPAEIADFYSAISAGYWGVFLVAKIVRLVMHTYVAYSVFKEMFPGREPKCLKILSPGLSAL